MVSRRDAWVESLLEKQLASLHSAMSFHAGIRHAMSAQRGNTLRFSELSDKEKRGVHFDVDGNIIESVIDIDTGNAFQAKEEVVLELAREGKGFIRSLSALANNRDHNTFADGHGKHKHAYDPEACELMIDEIALAAGRSLGEVGRKRQVSASSSDKHPELLEPLLSEDSNDTLKSQRVFADATEVGNVNASGVFNRELKEAKLRRRRSMFPQLEDIKEMVHTSLGKPRYNVEEHYHDSGFWQGIARNAEFNNFTLVVIVCNTIWMSIDTDYNTASILCKAPLMFQIADNFFCSIFSFEILVRFMAFRHKFDALRDWNFTFDAFLVGLMVWETWIMVAMYLILGASPGGTGAKSTSVLRLCRIFRLMRVARTARLLHQCPELSILARSITIGLRSVMTILVLLMLVIYIFAIMFTQLLAGTDIGDGKFHSVSQSINFLLLQVLCGFDAQFIDDLRVAGWIYYLLFLIFLLLTSLTIMNMLIGILCDVVSTVAAVEKDEAFDHELETQVLTLAHRLDKENTGSIDEADFNHVTRDPALAHTLHELGVDVVAISDYASFVFSECGSLSYTDFLHMVSQFRGAKSATVKDCMDLRKYFAMELALVKCSIEACLAKTDRDLKSRPVGGT